MSNGHFVKAAEERSASSQKKKEKKKERLVKKGKSQNWSKTPSQSAQSSKVCKHGNTLNQAELRSSIEFHMLEHVKTLVSLF